MPLISNSGMKTAISEMLIDMTVKPISRAPLMADCSGVVPASRWRKDIFHHDDRVIDDEADGNRHRHQRQIVEAEAERDR